MKLKPPSRAASSLTLGLMLLVATTIFAQQLSTPRGGDQTTAKLVAGMVTRHHVSQAEIDDGISAKLLKRYLEDLDPQKLYFTQSDIDSFQPLETELDDLVKTGNVDFAYQAFDVYLKRLDERIALVQQLIDAEHDFTADETMATDPDDLPWAATEADIHDRWRKRIKYDLLTLKIDGTELKKARERLHKRYHSILVTMRQTEDLEKLELYLTALTHSFDPHSSYMSPRSQEDFEIVMSLKLQGIGAALRSEDGYTVVAQIVPGGAADKDGRLKVGDRIIGVGQATGDLVDVVETKLSKVVELIRGKKGTKVRLQVKPADTDESQLYELTRQEIELKSSEVKGEIIETSKRITQAQARIGVIHIPSFYRDFEAERLGSDDFKSTQRDVRKVLAEFRDAGGVDAVVIDLRTNGGGALREAIEVSGLFIDRGPVVQVKEPGGRPKPHDDTDRGAAYSGPLIVLCNQLSASASEIFAGVIKDYRRGIIVGDKTTHGKGTVQNVMPVSKQFFQLFPEQDRGALKLTIQQFYRVNGDSTQKHGVPSDIVLPSLLDHMDLGESFLDGALAFDQVQPADYTPLNFVSPEIISQLSLSSQQRVGRDPEFEKINKEIAEYLKRKSEKFVSLNEETLRKERLKDGEQKKDEADVDEQPENDPNAPVFPVSAYNDEVLRIGVEYLDLLRGLKTARN